MERIAVLTSGGLDSCVLLADLAQGAKVFPIYVRFGLAWEEDEQKAVRAFIKALGRSEIPPLEVLEMPIQGVYGRHWSMTGEGVPASDAPDSDVYLPGRNVLLIGLIRPNHFPRRDVDGNHTVCRVRSRERCRNRKWDKS